MMSLPAHNKIQRRTNAGFTLVEMLVSVSIFAIAMTVSMGTLIVLIAAGNVAQQGQIVSSNLSFAIDSISREMRTGYSFYCADVSDIEEAMSVDLDVADTNDCSGGNKLVAFTDGKTGFRTAYYFNDFEHAIYGLIAVDPDDEDTTFPFPLTSDDVYIDDLQFFVTGSTVGDTEQPQVRIILSGHSSSSPEAEPFYLQTTIVSRVLDL